MWYCARDCAAACVSAHQHAALFWRRAQRCRLDSFFQLLVARLLEPVSDVGDGAGHRDLRPGACGQHQYESSHSHRDMCSGCGFARAAEASALGVATREHAQGLNAVVVLTRDKITARTPSRVSSPARGAEPWPQVYPGVVRGARALWDCEWRAAAAGWQVG